uniref:Uncharacterized protein n=1 Tax=Cacopsylla melanoneura TaxID=428564 RepID=A0A8D9E4T2_9HEMI
MQFVLPCYVVEKKKEIVLPMFLLPASVSRGRGFGRLSGNIVLVLSDDRFLDCDWFGQTTLKFNKLLTQTLLFRKHPTFTFLKLGTFFGTQIAGQPDSYISNCPLFIFVSAKLVFQSVFFFFSSNF